MPPSLGLRATGLGAFVLAVAIARPGTARESRVDYIEVVFGATNIAATTGNGGLTAGVSRDGDLTVLSWPSPSFYDQLHYLSANGIGARQRPRMGAREGMGAFAGLIVSVSTSSTATVTMLRDPAWDRRVAYAADESSVIETRFENAELGLVVTQTDAVPMEADVLLRRFEVERAPSSRVISAKLLFYANLSPGLSKLPEIPVADVFLDHKNDFLAVWDRDRGEIVQFHPEDTGIVSGLFAATQPIERDFGPIGEIMQSAAPDDDALDALVERIDQDYAPGVYAILSAQPAPDGFQVGGDATDSCGAYDAWADELVELEEVLPEGQSLPVDPSVGDLIRCGDWDPLLSVAEEEGWAWRPADALLDAKDGTLSKSRVAGAQVNTALTVPLRFDAEGVAEATVELAFGRTHADAKQALDSLRGRSDVIGEVIAEDRVFSERIRIPAGIDEELRAFLLRVFLNIRVGTDRETGAIVASISRQPPYQLDWPRDGAFFNAALDVAGLSDLVTRRQRFYASVMRTEPVLPTLLIDEPVPGWPDCPDCERFPPSSWEMNYYADGTTGGNIRLEIDNSALLVWSFVFHFGYLEGAERERYAEEIWPTVEAAADFLATWRDPRTKLVWPANEDDNAPYTQGLQSAVTVLGGLRAAAKLGLYLGHEDVAKRWIDRGRELQAAMFERLYQEEVGFLRHAPGLPGAEDGRVIPAGGGASAWLGWPARLLSYDDPRLHRQLEKDVQKQLRKVRGYGPGAGYVTKATTTAALVFREGQIREDALEIATTLATKIAQPETHELGEVFLNIDDDGDGIGDRYENATSTPHLWAATLVYLTVMAYHEPERFDRHEAVLPAVSFGPASIDEGCGCRSSRGATDGSGAGVGLLLGLFVAELLRRRTADPKNGRSSLSSIR